jgi:peptidoglycan hydrolase-like protein with peptidoglycan-binding domain
MKKTILKMSLCLGLTSMFSGVGFAASIISPVYLNGDYDTNNTSNCYNLSQNMRKGDKDNNTNGEVTKLQEALSQLGFLFSDPTGYYGNATVIAVKSYQSANSLSPTGYVGSYTRSSIQSKTCNSNNLNTNNYQNDNSYINVTCSLNTMYIGNRQCVCPTNYVLTPTAISNGGAFVCQPYNTYNQSYNSSNYNNSNNYNSNAVYITTNPSYYGYTVYGQPSNVDQYGYNYNYYSQPAFGGY